MPLFNKKEIFPNYQMAVWQITEPEEYFIQELDLQESELHELNNIKGNKRREWLSARMLLYVLSSGRDRPLMYKDEFGKPHLKYDVRNLSISHSHDYSAIGFSERHIGIDIQKELAKIERIKYKFLHPSELKSISENKSLDKLHYFWGAKESIYKAYGKKQLRFAEQIILEAFEIKDDTIDCAGSIILEEERIKFNVKGEKFDNYYLVYAIEN